MFKKILLAVDGSEPSTRAVEVCKDLALSQGAEVIVLHVKEHDRGRGFGYELETREEASEIVDSAVRTLKDAGVSARGELFFALYGHAAREILSHAHDEKVDVIAMGSRGLSDLAGLVVGSVAHKVLHLAQTPVLIVR